MLMRSFTFTPGRVIVCLKLFSVEVKLSLTSYATAVSNNPQTKPKNLFIESYCRHDLVMCSTLSLYVHTFIEFT